MYFKQLYFSFLEWLEPILDSISSRLCFLCHKGLGALICEECLESRISLKKKIIDYKILDNFFADYEQVFHPKIFFLIKFCKNTSYLIKKAKYSRPHFSKFLASCLASCFCQNVNKIFNDELNDVLLNDSQQLNFPVSSKSVNLYFSAVPMYWQKEQERTFNFSQLLTRELALILKGKLNDDLQLLLQSSQGLNYHSINSIEFIEDLFLRCKNTQPFFDLGQESRIKEIQNAFAVNPEKVLEIKLDKDGLNILLIIDDICTTGSTLMEMMQVARQQANFTEHIALTLYGRNLD